MTRCKTCGTAIDQVQVSQFDGLCSECIRSAPLKSMAKSEAQGWLMFVVSGTGGFVVGLVMLGLGFGTEFFMFSIMGTFLVIAGPLAAIFGYTMYKRALPSAPTRTATRRQGSKFCVYCGAAVRQGVQYCEGCGQPFQG
ncbi:MAG: hypothetical protein ACFE9L_00190 [Candidatus Hodarchaeota archaeon]